jgi:hypothetical protein
MAKIYASASRVVVWVEETTDGDAAGERVTKTASDEALQELGCIAVGGRRSKLSPGYEASQRAILSLVERSWFQRVWVSREP